MLFPEFTAGELLVRSCRSALQARIAVESRSCSKYFCNDRVNTLIASILMVVTCGVHASGMRLVMRAVRLHGQRKTANPMRQTRMYWIGGTVLLMFLVSVLEVLIWAVSYLALNAIEGV